MRGAGAKVATVFALAAWASTLPGEALACACNFTRSYALAQADLAFVGRVIRTRTEGDEQFAFVERVRSLKGSAPATLEVSTSSHAAMCGWNFDAGETLTFGVSRREDKFATNSCLMGPLNRARRNGSAGSRSK